MVAHITQSGGSPASHCSWDCVCCSGEGLHCEQQTQTRCEYKHCSWYVVSVSVYERDCVCVLTKKGVCPGVCTDAQCVTFSCEW